jgi:hypothetical protein
MNAFGWAPRGPEPVGVRFRRVLALAASFLIIGAMQPREATAKGPASSVAGPAIPDDFSGVWIHQRGAGRSPGRNAPTDKIFTLNDGTPIPFTPAGEEIYRRRVAMNAADKPFATTQSRCLPMGVPLDMLAEGYPLQFVQRPDVLMIGLEEGWNFRVIHINGGHPSEIVPSFFGHSVAHWEGKTLVVETVSMRDDTTMGGAGLPHSVNLKMVERISRAGTRKLKNEIVLEDPTVYFKPLVYVSYYDQSDEEMIEYVCENARISVNPYGAQTYLSH